MSDGTEKLATTLAETISTVSKSFSEHAPEVWQSAVAYQKSTAVIEIVYSLLYVSIALILYFFVVSKLHKPIKELKEAGANMCDYQHDDGINHDSYQIYQFTRGISAGLIAIFIMTQMACTSTDIKRLVNPEYYAAIELMEVVK